MEIGGRKLFVIPGTTVERSAIDDRQIVSDALFCYHYHLGALDWIASECGAYYGPLHAVCLAVDTDYDGAQAIQAARDALADFIARRADADAYVARGWAKSSFWRPEMTPSKVAEVRSRVVRAQAILDSLKSLDALPELTHSDLVAADERRRAER